MFSACFFIYLNYSTCFHDILKTLPFTHIKKNYNIIQIFTLKLEKPNFGYVSYVLFICECIFNEGDWMFFKNGRFMKGFNKQNMEY